MRLMKGRRSWILEISMWQAEKLPFILWVMGNQGCNSLTIFLYCFPPVFFGFVFLNTRIFPHASRYRPTPETSFLLLLPGHQSLLLRPRLPTLSGAPLFPSWKPRPHDHAPDDARRLVRGDSRGHDHYPACPAARWRSEGSGQRQKVCCGIGVVGPGV